MKNSSYSNREFTRILTVAEVKQISAARGECHCFFGQPTCVQESLGLSLYLKDGFGVIRDATSHAGCRALCCEKVKGKWEYYQYLREPPQRCDYGPVSITIISSTL